MRDRSVVKSSVIPSAKYSCSGSRAALENGSTTIDCAGALVRLLGLPRTAESIAVNLAWMVVPCPDDPYCSHSAQSAANAPIASTRPEERQNLVRPDDRESSAG